MKKQVLIGTFILASVAASAQIADNAATPSTPTAAPEGGITLINQPSVAGVTQGLISSAYATAPLPGTYVAIDFVVPAGPALRINSIFADGFVSNIAPNVSPALSSSVGIDYVICTNNAGTPGCVDPNVASAQRLFFQTAAIGSAGLTIGGTDNADPTWNLVTANVNWVLQPGTYWLVVAARWNAAAPGTNAVNGRWNWLGATQVGAEAHLIGGTNFNTIPNWTLFSALGATITIRDTIATMTAAVAPVVQAPRVPTPAVNLYGAVALLAGLGLVGALFARRS